MRECAAPNCANDFEQSVWNQKYCSLECKQAVKNQRRRRTYGGSRSPSEDMVSVSSQKKVHVALQDLGEDDDGEVIEFLRRENRRLTNLATKYKNVKREQVGAIYEAAYDALSEIQIEPVTPPKESTKGSIDEEVANPFLSDFQLGKRTESYNSDICRDRIEQYGDHVIEKTEVQRAHHPVECAHVYILGDIVEGERIFPGQAFEIDSSLYKQVTNGVEITLDFLRRMLSSFQQVHVAAVIGNHGWLGRPGDYNPESNMDRLLYTFVAMMMENEPRITFDIPEGDGDSHFYTVDRIGHYSTLLLHGDQLPKPTSTHGYLRKILSWKDGGIKEKFNDVAMGHYHQNAKFRVGGTNVRIAGSPESNNTYAQERLGVMSDPSQHLQFVSPIQGQVTSECDIYLN